MRILASGLLFFFFFLFYTFAVPPSPAGGGYFRIYKPGDYALASDHRDFEVIPEKTGFTIEMWIYLEQPMREFVGAKDKEKQIPGESWVLIYKAGSYQLRIGNSVGLRLDGPGFSAALDYFDAESVCVNQWHYLAFMLDANSVQVILDDWLYGDLWNEVAVGGEWGLDDTDAPLCIGGGTEPGPWPGQPFWHVFPNGLIDEVRISNIVRYPRDEIDAKFLVEDNTFWGAPITIPTAPFEPDEHTLALWHFNFEGYTGSKWRDASGNGHHLTYHGTYLNVPSTGKLPVIWGALKRQ